MPRASDFGGIHSGKGANASSFNAFGSPWLAAMLIAIQVFVFPTQLVATQPGVARALPRPVDEIGLGDAKRRTGVFEGRVYEIPENSRNLPDFSTIDPVGSIYSPALDVAPRNFNEGFPGVTDRFEWFAIRYRGRMNLEKSGLYRFRTISDDGVKVFINNELVIDHDSLHPPSSRDGEIELDAGSHCVTVEYFQGPAFQIALQLFMAPPEAEYSILDLRNYAGRGISYLFQGGCGAAPFPWLELILGLLGLGGFLEWLRRRRRDQKGEKEAKEGFSLSFPELADDRPAELLYAHQLAADANLVGEGKDARARTRLRIVYNTPKGKTSPAPQSVRLRIRSPAHPTQDDKTAAVVELLSGGKPIGDEPIQLPGNSGELELRCEPRAESWTVETKDGKRTRNQIHAASFVVELIGPDGKKLCDSPTVTVLHGAPHSITLCNGPEELGIALGDLTGINRKSLKVGEPIGRVFGTVFRFPSTTTKPLHHMDLRLGADRLLSDGTINKKKHPVPMATAVLILFVVRDRFGNPVRLLEADEYGYYRPTFWIGSHWGGGLKPFFVSPSGLVADAKKSDGTATEWVAKPSPASALQLGAYGTLFVPAGADFSALNKTPFHIRVEKVIGTKARTLIDHEFIATVKATPYADKWARWLLSGEVEDGWTFGAEIMLSLVPIVGDGRDLVLHMSKEWSANEEAGLLDRLVAMLALAGLTLDIANILTVGGTTPIDAAVGALKASVKLLRKIADPRSMIELWQKLATKEGEKALQSIGEQAAKVADDTAEAAAAAAKQGDTMAIAVKHLAEELYKRLSQFLNYTKRGKTLDSSEAVIVLKRTFGDFAEFGRAVKPIITDIDKLQRLLSLMGLALAAVQLKQVLALFAGRSADEVMDLLAGLVMMDQAAKDPPDSKPDVIKQMEAEEAKEVAERKIENARRSALDKQVDEAGEDNRDGD